MINEEQFCVEVAEILSVDPCQLAPEIELESFAGYSSVAVLSLMVCLSDFTSREWSLAQIRSVRTYGDLLKLASE